MKTVAEVKSLKDDLEGLEQQYAEKYAVFEDMLLRIPSPALSDVPVGTEDDNQVIKFV